MRRICTTLFLVLLLVTSNVAPVHAESVRYEAEAATIVKGAVEANHSGFTGSGFVNYDNVSGSYVEWAVTIPQAGWGDLVFRFANGTNVNRPMDIWLNGELIQADVEFRPTGSWSTWLTYVVNPLYAAGTNTIRAVATTSNGGPNVDSVSVEVTAPTLDYQAEEAVISGGSVATNHSGFTGSGFVDYALAAGGYVEWTLTSPGVRASNVHWRYANGSSVDRPMRITVNGISVYDAMAFPPTGSWNDWDIAGFTILLQPGVNLVRATALTSNGGPNIDKIVGSVL